MVMRTEEEIKAKAQKAQAMADAATWEAQKKLLQTIADVLARVLDPSGRKVVESGGCNNVTEDPYAVVYKCGTCGEMFITDRTLTNLMVHHEEKHREQTSMNFVPV